MMRLEMMRLEMMRLATMRLEMRPTARLALGRLLALLLLTPGMAFGKGAADDRALIGQLDREIIALQQRVAQLETLLATCGTAEAAQPMYAELTQLFATTPVRVVRAGGSTRVTFPGDFVFPTGGLRIREEAAYTFDLLSTALQLHPDDQVIVIGYTDNEPPPANLRKYFQTNWELSAARATVVGRELIETYKIASGRVTVAGRGAEEPVAENDTPEGRAQNRRIVIVITPGVAR